MSSAVRHSSGSRSPAAPHDTAPKTRPPLLPASIADLQGGDLRRPSIQFKAHANVELPRGSPKVQKEGNRTRMSSPPPPPVFQPRVSFDTFERQAEFIEENAFTRIVKHKDYEYTRRSRTFLCGYDDNEYSDYALQWLIDQLVDDGDEIVCLRVVEKDDTIAGGSSVEQGRYREEADALMKSIQGKNGENKAINLILEFAIGKVHKVIDEMINLYEPAILVVGTRGRSLGGFQGLLPGSVSKYCLQHSPVPVIVVRPSSKRDKARSKRAQDPSRHGYKEILEKSGSGALSSFVGVGAGAADDAGDEEAAAVAAAIGYHPAMGMRLKSEIERDKAKSPKMMSLPIDEEEEDEEDEKAGVGVEGPRSSGVVMKSPELGVLDSPSNSDVSSSEEEEQGQEHEEDQDQEQGGVPMTPTNTGTSYQATTEGLTESPTSEASPLEKTETKPSVHEGATTT